MTTYFEHQIQYMAGKMLEVESELLHLRNEVDAQTEEIKRLRQESKADHREILGIRLKMDALITEVAHLETRA